MEYKRRDTKVMKKIERTKIVDVSEILKKENESFFIPQVKEDDSWIAQEIKKIFFAILFIAFIMLLGQMFR